MYSQQQERQDASQIQKLAPVDVLLTPEQHAYIQHYLPKGFVFIQVKSGKRQKKQSTLKIEQNISRLSDDMQSRFKRQRLKKKNDRYLQQEAPKPLKRGPKQKNVQLPQDMMPCLKILNSLKKNTNSWPFLVPVNVSDAPNYFDIISEPMDLSTVEKKLKAQIYGSPVQFYQDIDKIWKNSYAYNQKGSPIYQLTSQMQNYYKKIFNQIVKGTKQVKIKTKMQMPIKKNSDSAPGLSSRIKSLPNNAKKQFLEICQDQNLLDNQNQIDQNGKNPQILQNLAAIEQKYQLYDSMDNQQ